MDLFSPIEVGNYTLKNRIFMAPMTRCRSVDENTPNDLMIEYYIQRASAGLIITEATQISPVGIGYPATPGIYTQRQIDGWKKITDAVHKKGTKMFLQLWHVGRISHSSFHPKSLPLSPSAIKPSGQIYTYKGLQDFETPKAMSIDEIHQTVQDYAAAAKNAIKAGFDGVEIHGANGYLIDQFLRDGTNKRQDEYGGDIQKRSRFLFEIVEIISKEIGSKRVGVRLSPSGTFNDMSDSEPHEHFRYVCEKLNNYNLAYLHIVDALEGDIRHGANVVDLSILRTAYKGVLIVNGGYDKQKAQDAILNNKADAVAFANLFLANPDLPYRFQVDAKLNKADPATFYTQDEKGYTDYPVLPKS